MLCAVPPEAWMALEQVSKFPRWADIDKLIELELTTILDRMLGATETAQLHELRGRAKALKEFQKEVAQAGSNLAKVGLRSPIA